MTAAGATVLSVDAGRTLMLDGDAIIKAAEPLPDIAGSSDELAA